MLSIKGSNGHETFLAVFSINLGPDFNPIDPPLYVLADNGARAWYLRYLRWMSVSERG